MLEPTVNRISMTSQFNPHLPTVLYIDMNSCFATVEQQAHPKLRGKPLAVVAYETENGIILAASYEAKAFGIRTGMRVYEAKKLCPSLYITIPDPEKYRYVNEQLKNLMLYYSPHVQVQSIDEMIVWMNDTPSLEKHMDTESSTVSYLKQIGKDMKQKIKETIGETITVSIGIAPNAFLAKTASNLKKPDGLEEITGSNIESVLTSLSLTDLCGIKEGNARRLRCSGITTPFMMYTSTPTQLEHAFGSILGRYWWLWLHGYEAGSVYTEKQDTKVKSYSQSSSLVTQGTWKNKLTIQIIYQLVEKMATRLRTDGCRAQGVLAGCSFTDGTYWQKRITLKTHVYATEDIFSCVTTLIHQAPELYIHTVFVGLFSISPDLYCQTTLDDVERLKQTRTKAIDTIYHKFGSHMVTTGISLNASQHIVDRIAFGKRGVLH